MEPTYVPLVVATQAHRMISEANVVAGITTDFLLCLVPFEQKRILDGLKRVDGAFIKQAAITYRTIFLNRGLN